MQRLPLSYIKPGMITYEEVVDANGRTLCGKNIELTEEWINRFYELGVNFVTVKGHPVKLPWEKTLDQELKELEERFKGVDNPNLLKIKEILVEFLKEKYEKD